MVNSDYVRTMRNASMIVTRDHTSLDSSVLDHFLNVHDQRWNMEDLCKLDVSWVARFRNAVQDLCITINLYSSVSPLFLLYVVI